MVWGEGAGGELGRVTHHCPGEIIGIKKNLLILRMGSFVFIAWGLGREQFYACYMGVGTAPSLGQ